jgi:hypothetical protein
MAPNGAILMSTRQVDGVLKSADTRKSVNFWVAGAMHLQSPSIPIAEKVNHATQSA